MPPARIALYSASVAAVAVLVRSLVIGPLPLWLAGTVTIAYIGMIAVGILRADLEMFGDATVRGRPDARSVALTFDDGPDPEATRAILEILAREGDRATFFVVGERVDRNPDVVREIVAAGHSLGVHGYRHAPLHSWWSPRAIARDIEQARDAVERATGVRPRFFRPPIGIVSPRTASGARRARAPIVLFSLRSGDGVVTRVDAVVRRVIARLGAGAIVLLHDAPRRGGRSPASIGALPRILDRVHALGLATVGVEAMVDDATIDEEPSAAPERLSS